ncbi:MAG: hypothetical protein WA966_10575 [Ornithinimicrobium sp.]
MADYSLLPRLIEVEPTTAVAFGALVPVEGSSDSQTLLLIDLGFAATSLNGRRQVNILLDHGFVRVQGLNQVFPPALDWSYRTVRTEAPELTTVTLLAGKGSHVAYDGIFIGSPEWFEQEQRSGSAAVAIANFGFSDLSPSEPGFHSRVPGRVEAVMKSGGAVGASMYGTRTSS